MDLEQEKFDEKSCGVVVFREQDGERFYLVLKYPSGHFDFAKGHVEAGEDEHTTALRELEEETGISQVKLLDGYREQINYTYRRKGMLSRKQVIFFLGQTEEEKITISFEHTDGHFLPYKEALSIVTFDNAKNLLGKAEEFLNNRK